jgi:uncharacterized protein (TIGR00288 family)
MKNEQSQLKLAVLIDADNTQAKIIEGLLAEVAKYGIASVKRIYGDWTNTNLRSWKDKLLEFAIQPVQQFSYTSGKNSTDSAMIIDAMDLLYTENLDGFCVVSSDSDFTRLAARLREDGKLVLGFGQRKTPKPFVAACDKFIYTEILRPPKRAAAPAARPSATKSSSRPAAKPAPRPVAPDVGAPPLDILRDAVDSSTDESGWAHLGRVGQVINNQLPDFDSRNFGFRNIGALFESIPDFEVRRQGVSGGPQTVHVRVKPEA